MTQKPTYEELENRIKELESMVLDTKQSEEGLLPIMSEAEKLANFGSWEWDIVRDKWKMSDNWLKIHGYKHKVLTTEELLTIAHPDDINRIQAAFDECIKSGVPYKIEHRIIKQDTKEVRDIRAYGRVQSDSAGKPVKLYGAAQDITEYKRQEIELKQSEEQYRALVEKTPDLITKVDSEGQIIFVNHAAQNVYGIPPKECLGRSAFDFIHPEDRDETVASFNDWLRYPDNTLTYENRIVSIDGHKTHHMAWMILPERDESGSVIGFAGTARDITDHKLTEEALRKSNKDLQLAQRIANIGNWTLDPEVGVPEWTDEVYRIYEREPQDGPCPVADYKNIYKGEWYEKFYSAIKAAIHEGQPYDIELKLELSPDNVKWVHAICQPEPKPGSKGYFLRGTIQDITKLKEAEHERENLIVQLEEKAIEQERLMYTVSHDLKSPLVTINGFCAIAKEEFGSGDVESGQKNLDVVSNAAKRMQRLLGDLLEISRAGFKVNPSETFNLSVLINETIENISGVISDNNTTIEIDPDLPDVTVDRKHFLQATENLITNASRYSRSAKEGSLVNVGIVKDAEELTCYVKDNGIGIETEYLEKIFGLFERLDTKSDSTGVGLAIVKRIIETHGGRIWAESAGLGHGTTFFFTLPELKP